MGRVGAGTKEAARIDAALQHWRQGDAALGERWFFHAADPAQALTPASADLEEPGVQVVESETFGLVVVSQTCDVVRGCVERPYVEVSPLVEVGVAAFAEIQRGRRPAYAAIPALTERRLVVDLDRVMTVEKALMADWVRTPGCTTDDEVRALSEALARKRRRFAFPDDFTAHVSELRSRVTGKHARESEEGRALRGLREIRVRASPSWDAAPVELMFWFIRNEEDAASMQMPWHEWLERWLELVPAHGRFVRVYGQVTSLERLTADEYVHSDPLDLDHLSSRG